ncbi:methylenetetrahydrofolate reductase (NADPH), variant 2 [Blastomyces gilchristii SLH14081]|uniref:Methylenetetrahydrofolate reductase (NADPH) n=1 Tax=Blastomyces gilchristii (strain SLH14081) TaxID=559298 RepID=A0A179U9H4_BLAGS|nr:methylenetetrahydrofolate reductase (NADPH), variant 1 [Blastomyces gilchristii SLH14081]XP_031575907.1 methylenetetrahydrofolate reductase (NADPH) [Blastomyces gilchristii SLH14081]XP_031575908.1 methylenetetrahydrofolate reductase (NADPH), variant 2 [Blastomyces gilchristii SLH14081]OAT03949.1 methylenetetrahydrofolate reductase (NADPH) [Blastomyces gilchristii SLH14081]OAT03950.1 methylenetetrahydrofolate reductase (NADPH), variant 1 [Blastomyces gilchristii SLH14081]OAT03951.1 methylene
MHIKDKLAHAEATGRPGISFEFFPPKTAQGVQNLYDRMDRMHGYGPSFIDITWGAGGRLSELTCEMVNVAQSVYGLETCMHLTCTDMPREKVDTALQSAFKAGCTNILALRGDPPREKEKWEATEGGFRYAKDLVKYIRDKYGNHFDIGVAGYPEGCDDQDDPELLMEHLKEKVDAGGTFIITQMFYDVDNFLTWVERCRQKGITVPIIPGIMPIHTYAAFIRRSNWTKIRIPPDWLEALEPVKNDDAAVRNLGKSLVADMCKKILASGIYHLHFYTMNLQQATKMILDELGLIPSHKTPLQKPLPWRQSLGLGRREEDVRPIFWRHRHQSYVARTQTWDEYPNGRWTDSRSPAFGELDTYGIGLKGTNEQNIKLWGEPKSLKELSEIFIRFLNGSLDRLPWSEGAVTEETEIIKSDLLDLNRKGFLTINSQPAIDGMPSSHPIYGWGPKNGYVYQKAYLELLISPTMIDDVISRIEQNSDLTYYCVNKKGELKTNTTDSPNAVTWGIFASKEIIQPTIVETISFLAWKDEAYRLGDDWAKCHAPSSLSRRLIEQVMDTWYLVNIVNNDFHKTHDIFNLFKDLKVENLDTEIEPIALAAESVDIAQQNGQLPQTEVNDSCTEATKSMEERNSN